MTFTVFKSWVTKGRSPQPRFSVFLTSINDFIFPSLPSSSACPLTERVPLVLSLRRITSDTFLLCAFTLLQHSLDVLFTNLTRLVMELFPSYFRGKSGTIFCPRRPPNSAWLAIKENVPTFDRAFVRYQGSWMEQYSVRVFNSRSCIFNDNWTNDYA